MHKAEVNWRKYPTRTSEFKRSVKGLHFGASIFQQGFKYKKEKDRGSCDKEKDRSRLGLDMTDKWNTKKTAGEKNLNKAHARKGRLLSARSFRNGGPINQTPPPYFPRATLKLPNLPLRFVESGPKQYRFWKTSRWAGYLCETTR